MAEESSLNARNCREIGFIYTNNRRSDEKQYIVVCTDLYEKEVESDPEEFIENHWVSLDEVKKMMTNGELRNVNLLAALGLYLSKQI